MESPDTCCIIGGRVNVTNHGKSLRQFFEWADNAESRYVCFCTVHMIMEAHDSPEFAGILNSADFINPDGMPLVWVQRLMGAKDAQRVTGPDTSPMICEEAARRGIPVGFYGGSEKCIENLKRNMLARYPDLRIAYAYSPPFRPLTPEEDEQITEEIRASGTRLLFIGLGCPKQERWMQAHRGRIPAVMFGVGAMFDFYAGGQKRAPRWVQNAGLEWFYRLGHNPKRLWRRYLSTNPRFVALVSAQLLGLRRFARSCS